jgi:hypothetical protein
MPNVERCKVKLSLQQALEAGKVVSRGGSHFLDSRPTGGSEVVSHLPTKKIPGTHVC